MKTEIKILVILAAFLTMVTSGCSSSPSVSIPDELDLAIRDTSDYLNDNIPEGSKIVILNMQSDSSDLSDYIIGELIANAVNDRIFTVVDREQLNLIRAEQDIQLSGEVADEDALPIGKFYGAQTIVSGRVSQIGIGYRMTIRALAVQTAQVQGQYNKNIAAGKTITYLINRGVEIENFTSAVRKAKPGNYIRMPSGKKYFLTKEEIDVANGKFDYGDLSDVKTEILDDKTQIKTISEAHTAYEYPDGQSAHIIKTGVSFTQFMKQYIEKKYFPGRYVDESGNTYDAKPNSPPAFDVFRALVQFQTVSDGIIEAEQVTVSTYNFNGKNSMMRYFSTDLDWRWGFVDSNVKPVGEPRQTTFTIE